MTRAQRPRGKRCPICGRPVQAASAPFCSPRCANEDLRRWLGGEYRIPTADDDEDGAEPGGKDSGQ